MLIVPLPGVGPAAARESLAAAHSQVGNVRAGGGTPLERFNAYQRWSNETARGLSGVLSPGDIDRLVTGPRYWALQTLDPATHGNLAGLLDLELDARYRDLAAAIAALDRVLDRRQAHRGQLVLPDTNAYLHLPEPIDQTDWNALVPSTSTGTHLIIPLIVVDELDNAKRSNRNAKVADGSDETVRTRARTTLKALEQHFPDPSWIATLRPDRFPEHAPIKAELVLDPPGHVRLADPDSELIDRALAVQALYGDDVTVITTDTGMLFRARAAGLRADRPEA